MPHDSNATLGRKAGTCNDAFGLADFASAKYRLRTAIFEAILDDAARAYELANWMASIADLRSRLSATDVNAILIDAAANYRAASRRRG